MKTLAILGASGHGKVVAETAELAGWSVVCFFDDVFPEKQQIGTWQIEGTTADLIERLEEFDAVHVAIGNNAVRLNKLTELRNSRAELASIIHPTAVISPSVILGDGVVVFASVVVNANTQVGFGAVLNTSCSVDHDCVIEDCVHISPGAHVAGQVTVGSCTWIGIGSSVIQSVVIGKNTTIGAGSAVISGIPDSCVAVGVPCRVIRESISSPS